MSEQEVAQMDEIYNLKPERVWLRITNCESPRRFQVILEVNGGNRTPGGRDKILHDAINECDGLISTHCNLTWLVNK